MEFNLFENLRGQAKQMAKVIKNMSPKVKDVTGFTVNPAGGTPIDKSIIQKKMSKFGNTKENSMLLQAKISAVLKDRKEKEAIYDLQDELSKESIYGTLLDQFMEDAFGIDPDDKVVDVEIIEDDENMRTLLQVFPDDLIQRTHLDEILTDYLKNTYLKYGELFLKKHYHRGQLVRFEVMEGKYVYPICNGLGILFFLVIDPVNNDFDILDEDEVLAFQLNPQLIKIVASDGRLEKILAEQPNELKALIPDAYKMGTPLLYNGRNELKRLKMANLLTDLAQLKNLAMPTLLAVNVENIRDEEQLSELLDTYEEYLEDIIETPDLSDSSNLDIESMMNTSIRVIPVEGSGKNGLTEINTNTTGANTDTSYLDKKKADVVLAVGFPLSALAVDSEATSKSDLSSNRRYRNRCKAAQRFIVRPLHQEILIDFAIQDIDVSPEQVRVFCKPIVSLDSAEDLEIALGAITQASQTYEQLLIIRDNSEYWTIDEEGYGNYFNTLLSPFKGAQQLIKKKEELEEEILPEDSYTEDEEEKDFSPPELKAPTPIAEDFIDTEEPTSRELVTPTEETLQIEEAPQVEETPEV